MFISNHYAPQFIDDVALGLHTAALFKCIFHRNLFFCLHLNKATLLRHSCRLLECRYYNRADCTHGRGSEKKEREGKGSKERGGVE